MLHPGYKNKMIDLNNLMTIAKYAEMRGISTAAVYKAISNGWNMPMVESVVTVSGKQMLVVRAFSS